MLYLGSLIIALAVEESGLHACESKLDTATAGVHKDGRSRN